MPPRFTPTKLVDYPWVVVRIECAFWGRAGRYRLARLAARYVPEQDLAGLLREIASACPRHNERARKYEPRCGARFVDLARNLPPPDHPDEPVYRQRQPGREDVAPPRRVDRFPATYIGWLPLNEQSALTLRSADRTSAPGVKKVCTEQGPPEPVASRLSREDNHETSHSRSDRRLQSGRDRINPGVRHACVEPLDRCCFGHRGSWFA